MPLTDTAIRSAKPQAKAVKLFDGLGRRFEPLGDARADHDDALSAAILLTRKKPTHRERVMEHLVVLERRADQPRSRVDVTELDLRTVA